jgi:glycosyltransferase involved in cell wall biosynthesis
MEQRLELTEGAIDVVWNGLDFSAYQPAETPPSSPTIGYLARMCQGKGLQTLVEAFIEIVRRDRVAGVRLDIAGAQTAADHEFVALLKRTLSEAGCSDRVTWRPNVTLQEKLAFLRGLSVLSVPATYGEAFGLYLLEAQACAVPVVQPRHGGFPEILAATEGGVLVDPDDVAALAGGLESLLLDPGKAQPLGKRGREAVLRQFSGTAMAGCFEAVLQRAIDEQVQPPKLARTPIAARES